MNKALELRLNALERRLEALENQHRPKLAWRAHIGWAKDDPLHEMAMKLGTQYRKSQR